MKVSGHWWKGETGKNLNAITIAAIDFGYDGGQYFRFKSDDEPGAYYFAFDMMPFSITVMRTSCTSQGSSSSMTHWPIRKEKRLMLMSTTKVHIILCPATIIEHYQ